MKDLYATKSENNAYRKGFKLGFSNAAFQYQLGTVNSKERIAFWDGVYDRSQYEVNKVKRK